MTDKYAEPEWSYLNLSHRPTNNMNHRTPFLFTDIMAEL